MPETFLGSFFISIHKSIKGLFISAQTAFLGFKRPKTAPLPRKIECIKKEMESA